jgi:hypothetical protein
MRVNRNLAVSSTVRQAVHNEPPALLSYREFIRNKITLAKDCGVSVSSSDIHPALKPHQRDIVEWACRGGRRAIFASFGLGKTLMQLEIMRQILAREWGNALIVCPRKLPPSLQRCRGRDAVDSGSLGWPGAYVDSVFHAVRVLAFLSGFRT